MTAAVAMNPNVNGNAPDPGQRVPRLAALGVSKAFPGVLALDDVSIDLYGGEVHGLVGENGAGSRP